MIKLTQDQIDQKKEYIKQYADTSNAADASAVDANANVTSKNVATLSAELYKDFNIQINNSILYDRIEVMYGKDVAEEFIRQLESHEIYVNDNSSLNPYCASINMFPLLLDGMKGLDGESQPPKHLQSYCGSFINMCFATSSQLAGAVGTIEFLLYFDHFARNDHGENYLETKSDLIESHFANVVYSISQPAAARGYQSIFWNISIYDEYYFTSLFEHFVFPDGDVPNWETLSKLQEFFMKWFNKERERALLTFPVITAAILNDGEKPRDEKFARMCARELSEGSSFFIYQSDTADSLSSCCRLRNEFTDNTFSMSSGIGGVSTGSVKVMTINMNRLIQDGRNIKTETEKLIKYLHSYRTLVQDSIADGMLSIYDAGFINIDKQFVTIGISGLVEGAESKGFVANNNKDYKDFLVSYLKQMDNVIKEKRKELGFLINLEFPPGESLNVKNSKWDKEDGYIVPRDTYTCYLYKPEDDNINDLDKLILHGRGITEYLSGGTSIHLNLDEYLTEEGFYKLLCAMTVTGNNFLGTNVKNTICNDCGFINKNTKHECTRCNSTDVSWITRIIGYLKKIDSFSTDRQIEESIRYYHKSSMLKI